MALIRATGKHRRPRTRSVRGRATGMAGLAAAGAVGTLTSPALAAGSEKTHHTGLTQAIDLRESVADRIAAQAGEQQTAAERAEAEETARKAAAALKKRAEEAEERAARAAEARRAKLDGYVAPVVDAVVSTAYHAAGGLWSSGSHSGIDFHAEQGTQVRSVAAGEVVEAGYGGAYGNNVVIKHRDGSYTQYGHLSSVSVHTGQSVESGEKVGRSGSTGNSTGPHLHFEARTGPEYGSDIDPVAYLREHGVSL